ncbi:YuzD family protein [Paenisporosarcina cavernae]|uniref:DUF1462 family protein n=1 Tax=Paenisporosarcina cavernae TaxID=2320858 RepID=A0A385YTU4_9BACL|nr:YuzD family protein [Paenisporosarcina cavernae]AYC29964.1 DUF1462 family protein [Paenisporosarcina cavernae]
MAEKNVHIEIYGTEIVCASCVNAPSSIDTYEWLQAAITRKYPDQSFTIDYIDIEQPIENDRQKDWAQKVQEDEYFYPLVLVENEVIGEGYIQLKPVYASLEAHGFIPKND